MRRTDIDKKFTETVIRYLMQGYTIHTNSMGGSQGEVAKVDLVKDETFLRVWLNRESSYSWHDTEFHGNMMVLRVGKWNRSAKEASDWCTVWMKDLETIEQHVFYEVRHGSDYYVSREEAIASYEVRRSRYQSTRFENSKEILIMNDKAREAAYKFLKRTQGYKRVSFNDIVVRKRINTEEPNSYYVVYHGQAYKMH